MEKTVLILFASCVLLALGLPDTPQYILTVPRNLWSGEKFTYCVAMVAGSSSETSNGDDITFSIMLINNDMKANFTLEEKKIAAVELSKCFQLTAPDQSGYYSLLISQSRSQIQPSGEIVVTMEKEYSSDVQIHDSSSREVTLIQTDRPLYKPGQTVKFRIMKLDKNFRPVLGVIPLVVVENPSGVRVMQWKNEDLKNGMASFEMQLSKEPPLGFWTIKATFGSEEKQTFEVKEYVLPKFEVTVKPPSYLLPTSPTIDGEICAKYTYGKPVKGKLELRVCYKSYGYYGSYGFTRPCIERLLKIDGCKSFSLNASELALDSRRYTRYGQLNIDANVTEDGTRIVLKGSSTGPRMSTEPFSLKMEDDTDNYFKGVFPYQGRVIATKPDGTPAAGELIEVGVKESSWGSSWAAHKNFTTNQDGIVKFSIEDIPDNVTGFNIHADAPMYSYEYDRDVVTLYQPRTSSFVRRWFSPSNSYMQIEDIVEPVQCGKDLELDVLYSTPPDTRYKFHIMVLSGSEVVYTSHHSHHFKIHDAINFTAVSKDSYLEEYTPEPPRVIRPPVIVPPLPPLAVESNATLAKNTTLDKNTTVKTTPKPDPEPQPVEEELIVPEISQPLFASTDRAGRKRRQAGGCVDFNGTEVQDGEMYKPEFDDPCKSCICEKGKQGSCHTALCFPSCIRVKFIPGKCCAFTCLEDEPVPEKIQSPPPPPLPTKVCTDNTGAEFKEGDFYTPDKTNPCEQCFCTNGKADGCQTIFCDAPPCPNYELIEGTCCGFTCLDSAPEPPVPQVCTDNTGAEFKEGDFYTPDKKNPCEQCFCTNGKADGCQMIFCSPPPCPNYELIEGTCCGFKCLDSAPEPPVPQPIVMSSHIARVRLQIPITSAMAPKSRVVLYYVREDKETIATSREFTVEKCFDNKVNMKFTESSVKPGTQATLKVQAAKGSICSVAVVDKSIDLLKADHRITTEKFYDMVDRRGGYFYSYWFDNNDYCKKKAGDLTAKEEGPARYGSYSYYDRNVVDALEAFRSSNLLAFSNVEIETRPCIKRTNVFVPYYGVDYDGAPGTFLRSGVGGGPVAVPMTRERVQVLNSIESNNAPKKTRSFFPETWLWELETVNDAGDLTINKDIPDTITEWVGNSICLSSMAGLGISPVAGVTAFQPFFLSFTLPYSAIRGEVLPVVITVFNYMPDCLVMNITLEKSNEFDLITTLTERTKTSCVCGGQSESLEYMIKPNQLGKINIISKALSIPDDGTCGNKVVSKEGTGESDSVRRTLLIEAEGLEKERTYSSYICPKESDTTENIELSLPSEVVKDSARGIVNVIGDVMGPALSNLQDLLKMPYGCGEQNAASFSPNIFVLQYFEKTNQAIESIVNDAKSYMRIGYQRQLRYRHPDGSYSAWGGEEGTSGSMWLTAFVIKCLGQAKTYIDVDERDLNKSISWFRRKQLENGCFPKVGYTHSYYLKGGFSSRSNDAVMTAFVLIAMLEAGTPRDDQAVLDAVRCLDIQLIQDTYTLTVLAYAYTLFDIRHARRQEVMDMLDRRAKKSGGMIHWERQSDAAEPTKSPNSWYRAPSAEVEMTAYALLAHVTGNQENAAANAQPIVLWLSKQRNSRGGFSSTQDTIVALQALSLYASLVHQGGIDLTVNVKGNGIARSFGISDQNNLLLQTADVTEIPNNLTINVRGRGCALVQADVKYNIPDETSGPAFTLKVKLYRVRTDGHCKRRIMNICVKFTGPGGISNMAIVDVKMQTGWIPDKTSLKELLKSVDSKRMGLQKYETDGSSVQLYFDKFDKLNRCFSFAVEQNIEVKKPKPAFVQVYDYYETELRVSTSYDIKQYCGTKAELPYLTKEEYEFAISNTPPDEMVQMRVPTDNLRLPGPLKPASCPTCFETFDTTGKDFDDLVCMATNIYKARYSGSSSKFSMKLYADMKPRKKVPIKKFANHVMTDTCSCSPLEDTGKKVMIFAEGSIYKKDEEKVYLDDKSTVITWSKKFEKDVFKKNKKC